MQSSFLSACLCFAAACGTVAAPAAGDPDGGGGTPDGPGVLALAAASHDFGDIGIGSASAVHTFTLSNIGGQPIDALSVMVTGIDAGQFAMTTSSCGTTLTPEAPCTISVVFVPRKSGALTATLTVSGSGDRAATSRLAGAGVPTALSVTPSFDSFGSVRLGTFAERSFVLTNTGGAPVATPALSFGASTVYTVGTNSCTGPLAAGDSCTFVLQFRPSAVGAQGAMLSVAAGSATAAAQLTGAGASAVVVTRTGAGTITGGGIDCGNGCSATVTASPLVLTAAASPGNRFTGWTGGAASCGAALTCTLPLTAGMVAIGGGFADIPTLTVTVDNTDPLGDALGKGSVEISPVGLDCTPSGVADKTCAFEIAPATITLTAVNDCSSFRGWTGACAGSGAECTLSLTGDTTTTAHFDFAACP